MIGDLLQLFRADLWVSTIDIIVAKVCESIVIKISTLEEKFRKVEEVFVIGLFLNDTFSNIHEFVNIFNDFKARLPKS